MSLVLRLKDHKEYYPHLLAEDGQMAIELMKAEAMQRQADAIQQLADDIHNAIVVERSVSQFPIWHSLERIATAMENAGENTGKTKR